MPKAFKFRLETLLEVRRLREDLARRDLAVARGKVLEQNRKLQALLSEEEEGKKELRALKQREIDLVRLRLLEGYLNSLERGLRRGFQVLEELVRDEAEKRRALAEAVKGVRVLERLEERQRRAYLYELDRQEQKFLDEVAQNMERPA